MSEVVETVNVVGADGKPLRINKEDFDNAPEGTYELHGKEAKQSELPAGNATPVPVDGLKLPATPSSVDNGDGQVNPLGEHVGSENNANPPLAQPGMEQHVGVIPAVRCVLERGKGKDKRYYVTDEAGNDIVADGVDPNGYADNAAAVAAIQALPH